MIAGAVMLLFSFLHFAGNRSAWGSGLFPIATLLPLYGLVMALQIGLTKFAGVKLPASVLGFTWEQIHLSLGLMAGLMALGWLSTGQLVGSLVGPIVGGALADLTGSYRIPFYLTSLTIFAALALVWFGVHEEFTRPQAGKTGRSVLAGLVALIRSPPLLALFFVLLMAQFGVRTVQPIVTLYVKEMVGDLPNVATLAGIAFSITGVANVISAPFLGNRSDRIGYRRVLLISLLGSTLTTLPQAFTANYWLFTAERFAVGLFVGGLLPTANALVGRLVPRSDRGTIYGMTSSAMFMGNSLGPLLGGFIAAGFGLNWVFLMTGAVLALNLVWVYYRVPEYRASPSS